jgi:1-phosphatidylinositol phosphodiesterase
MKKSVIIYGALLILIVVLTFVAVMPMQRSASDRSNWMESLGDDVSLNSLTIPGTHDSGALHSIAEISGKCQSLPIGEQLKIGVRFLDIRLRLVNNELKVVHSFTDQMTDFEDVLSDMTSFILDHQSEFLLVSIKEDASPQRSDRAFAEVLEEMLLSSDVVNRSNTIPQTVGAARGEIHIISRYKNASIGLPCYDGWKDDTSFAIGDVYIQDNYCVADVEEKIADIQKTHLVALEENYALVLNYTSCYLSSCFPPIYAGLPAHDINCYTQNAVAKEYGDGSLGVIVCDFITTELANAIIERNFR